MLLNVQVATEGEIKEIIKSIRSYGVSDLNYSYDDEDNLGFVGGVIHIGSHKKVSIAFQDRGTPCFFEYVVGRDRYDVHYPSGELAEVLTVLTQSAKEKRGFGLSLKEKLYGKSVTTKVEAKEDEMIMTAEPVQNNKMGVVEYIIITVFLAFMVGLFFYLF